MDELAVLLQEGDRRTVGRVDEVVARVKAEPSLFAPLCALMEHEQPGVRMRAADAAEKVSAIYPEWLHPLKEQLLALAASAPQQEVRWHLAMLLARLELTATERQQAAAIFQMYLTDKSRIVVAYALQGLAELAAAEPTMYTIVEALLLQHLESESPAVRTRSRNLLAWLAKQKQRAATKGRKSFGQDQV